MDKWKETDAGNFIRDLDGSAYLSYQPHTNVPPDRKREMDLLALSASILSGKEHTNKLPETAIVKNGTYWILNGDFRAAYDGCSTFEEAIRIFRAHVEHKSVWTSREATW